MPYDSSTEQLTHFNETVEILSEQVVRRLVCGPLRISFDERLYQATERVERHKTSIEAEFTLLKSIRFTVFFL